MYQIAYDNHHGVRRKTLKLALSFELFKLKSNEQALSAAIRKLFRFGKIVSIPLLSIDRHLCSIRFILS